MGIFPSQKRNLCIKVVSGAAGLRDSLDAGGNLLVQRWCFGEPCRQTGVPASAQSSWLFEP